MGDFTERLKKLSPQKLVLLAQELQSRLAVAERAASEPVAIIGVGCRFPGAPDADRFWRMLHDGVDAMREVPRDRWDTAALHELRPPVPGRTYPREAGFLDRIDEFDPLFFGISPREATGMDPQQRLLLEVTWEALEDAGLAPDRLDGSPTAVFVGISSIDFAQLLLNAESTALDMYAASGGSHAIASGRVSYTLGLRGASVSLDTACSSSLVAVHLACQSLRAGDARMALAAGVNLMISPETMMSLANAGMLSPDGRCKTFDAAANGFARGEGCGVVVLKRLSDAQADGDRILALVRGTAVNQDGRSSGITAPNGPAQEAVLREALERSSLAPGDVDYVETHGTGTVLGDPIELRALNAVLGSGRDRHQPLLIGSVKTNFGHLEASAGIAGLIKTVLALEHEEIPPHLHFTEPTPHMDWDRLSLAVTHERRPWPRSTRRRLAGVSSFGFSGTNAHIVLEEAPAEPTATSGVDRPLHLLALSAKTDAALGALAARYAAHFTHGDDASVADICFTANAGRAQFPHRLAVTGSSAADFHTKLSAFGESPGTADVHAEVVSAADPPDVAFLFTGQGAQYVGMGRELFLTQPAFRRTMERCDEILRPALDESLLGILYPEAGRERECEALLNDTRVTQPALFAIEYALAELWRAWGVTPAAVAGHSLGELVAACVAGVFSLEEALPFVAERARLMSALPAGGAMAAVFVDAATAEAAIAPYRARLAIAAVNGPEHVVLSGAEADLTVVLERLGAQGIKSTRLTVSHAFHSPLMDPMLPRLEAAAASIVFNAPRIGLVSNLSASVFTGQRNPDAAYWRCHARQPVRFAEGLQSLRTLGCSVFIEVGPHPVLLGMGRESLVDNDGLQWLPSLRRGRGDWQQMLSSVGALWTAGSVVDWRAFDREYARRKVVVPTYPFQRERYWPDQTPRRSTTSRRSEWRDWLYEPQWEAISDRGQAAVSDFIPSPSELAERVQSMVGPLVEQHGVAVYDELYPLVDRACTAYITDALRRLGWHPREGDIVRVDDLLQRLEILPRHRSLLGRMLAVLAEDGLLARDEDGWRVVRVPEREDPRALMADLLARFPQCEGELTLTARCADRISDVVRGLADPMQLLFPDGSLTQAEALYQHAPGFRLFNTIIAEVCATALSNRPEGRPVKVLEIGAGTGSTTASILPALAALGAHYVFTDISGLFTARAREKFRAFDFLEYRTLDIEHDPVGQGFAPGGFDLVVASNVLHATADLRATLRNVHRLLAPGGLLVLLEGTQPQRFGDLTVGLTDGWWRFNDDLRPSYALMPADRWMDALAASGFADPVACPDNTAVGHAIFANQSVIIARATQETALLRSSVTAELPAIVVLEDDGGEAARLGEALRARGRRVVRVLPRADWSVIDEQTYGLDPERVDHVQDLLTALGPALNAATFVHMRAVRRPAEDIESIESIESRFKSACASALAMVQALAACPTTTSPALVLVTRGAHGVGPDAPAVDAVQASLWGFGRVVALEHPELGVRLLDLAPGGEDASDIADLVLRDGGEDNQLAQREGRLYALRILPSAGRMTTRAASAFREDGTYLVTGGLNGLGLAVAEWMAARGARHLVLLGRSAPGERASAAIDRLRAAGIEVTIALGDVSSRSRLVDVLGGIDPQRPLRGVMHSAGVTDDAALVQMTWDRFERVMAAKVCGAWHLHELTAAASLDHFVLFSSGAGLLGSRGQSNHASANAFMDALAHHRRARGLAALSVSWGAWSEIGAATRGDILQRMEKQGLRPIDPANGLAALDHLLAAGVTHAGVLPIDRAAVETARSAAPLRVAARDTRDDGASAEFRKRLDAASQEVRHAMILARVRADAAAVLGFTADSSLQMDIPLTALGLDSLMSLELKNRIEGALAVQLPLRLFVDSTGEQLADAIVRLFEASPIEHLEQRLAVPTAPQTWRSLVVIQPGGTEPPLFVIPGVSGNVVGYESLAAALGAERPVYGLQSLGLDGSHPPFERVEDIASHFLDEIRSVQPKGPYHLAGACMGGAVAFEIAQRMRAEGEQIALLGLIDSWLNNHSVRWAYIRYWRPIALRGRRARKTLARLRATPPELRREFVLGKLMKAVRSLGGAKAQGDESRRVRVRVSRANAAAFAQYAARPYDGHITLIIAADRSAPTIDPRLDWQRIAASLSVYRLPGKNSGALLKGESARRVAHCLMANGSAIV